MRYDNPDHGKYQLIVRPVEGGDERALSSGPTSDALYQPAWSPDGKIIVGQMLDVANGLIRLVAVDATTGQRKAFFSSNQRIFDKPSWLPDGSGVLVLGRRTKLQFRPHANRFRFLSQGHVFSGHARYK